VSVTKAVMIGLLGLGILLPSPWPLAAAPVRFARSEGPLNPTGAVWQIELTGPRWPD
jgi:hypothetical protein